MTDSIQRVVWRHKNSGHLPVEGVGLASNTRPRLPIEDMNEQLTDLEFWYEEWHESGKWVRA